MRIVTLMWLSVVLVGAKPSGLTAERVKASWSVKVGPEAGARALAVHGERVLAVTWEGDLVALDAATGKRAWGHKADRSPIDGPWLAVAGGVAVVGRERSVALVGHAPADGREVWRRDLGATPTGVAGCPGARVVVATHRAKQTLVAHAVDPLDGKTLWQAPADGGVVGAGTGAAATPGYVFTGVRSGRGRLLSRIDAYRCADGARFEQLGTGSQYVSFVSAAGGQVVTRHFNGGATNAGQLCVTAVEGGGRQCIEPGALAPTAYPLGGAIVRGTTLFFSVAHITAHNLDPSPDSWLLAYDLVSRRVVGRSPPLTSAGNALDAGALLATGFGTTGADDFVYLVDPVDMRRVRTLALRKAPRGMAVDGKRLYVATYDGRISAMKLPLPGPAPRAEVVVEPAPSAQPAKAPASAVPLFGWRLERVVDAHPKRGRTSGQDTAGTVGAFAFLPGDRIAAGGNDDRVRVFDLATGKRLAQSGRLKKDVVGLRACADGGFIARIYGGSLHRFGAKHRKLRSIAHSGGWTFGASGDCATVVADDFRQVWRVYDGGTGKLREKIESRGRIDYRGLKTREDTLWIPRGGDAFQKTSLTSAVRALVDVDPDIATIAGEARVQLWSSPAGVVEERCSSERCDVRIGGRLFRFDTRGGVWSAGVPSTIDVSPDGRFLLFHRDGLETLLVRTEDDARQVIGTIPRTMSSTPGVAFAPDGRRFALTMTPKSHQVSVYAAPAP